MSLCVAFVVIPGKRELDLDTFPQRGIRFYERCFQSTTRLRGAGQGCIEDPLYPWIARTLANDRLSSPSARANQLQRKALTWLRHY